MKTVQQIMQETGAEVNIRNFRYMQENYTYKQIAAAVITNYLEGRYKPQFQCE